MYVRILGRVYTYIHILNRQLGKTCIYVSKDSQTLFHTGALSLTGIISIIATRN